MKVGCTGQAPDADGEYNYAFNLMERCRRERHRPSRSLIQGECITFRCLIRQAVGGLAGIIRTLGISVLSFAMMIPRIHPEVIEYRGYSLQVIYEPPQWQVSIATAHTDRPVLPVERQIVRGWNEAETLNRAKRVSTF